MLVLDVWQAKSLGTFRVILYNLFDVYVVNYSFKYFHSSCSLQIPSFIKNCVCVHTDEQSLQDTMLRKRWKRRSGGSFVVESSVLKRVSFLNHCE